MHAPASGHGEGGPDSDDAGAENSLDKFTAGNGGYGGEGGFGGGVGGNGGGKLIGGGAGGNALGGIGGE